MGDALSYSRQQGAMQCGLTSVERAADLGHWLSNQRAAQRGEGTPSMCPHCTVNLFSKLIVTFLAGHEQLLVEKQILLSVPPVLLAL